MEQPECMEIRVQDDFILPKMVRSVVDIYQGKTHKQVFIQPEVIDHLSVSSVSLQVCAVLSAQHGSCPELILHPPQLTCPAKKQREKIISNLQ